MIKKYLAFILILSFSYFAPIAQAYIASSSNYRLDADSVNIGGAEDGASPSYKIRDTIGEVGTGLSSSPSYNASAGYRAMAGNFISISSPSDVVLAPTISGISGGVATGTAAFTVVTDASAGYMLMVKSTTNPSMQNGGNNFADYTPSGANPDFAWFVPATSAEFGFSPEGSDIVTKYRDNGAVCNAGVLDTANACFAALSTTNDTVASSATPNNPAGQVTTLNFEAEVGGNKLQPSGTYVATVIVTGLAN